VGLFNRKKNNNDSKQVRILFTSDLHGSDIVFKKFLNAGKMYKVNALIIGGDLAGKALIPIIELNDGNYEIDGNIFSKDLLAQKITEIRNQGNYYVIVNREEFEDMKHEKRKVDEAFKNAMTEVVRNWIKIAEERYKGLNIPIYVNLGNDDPEYLFDVLDESDIMIKTEGKVVNIDKYEMISYGYVNPTPWHTPREMPEEKLYEALKHEVEKLSNPSESIFNFHAPPYGSNLDNAPLLDENLKPVVKGGEIVFTHVGSQAVRKIIEETQPLLGLHGHIHESRGFDKIGRTIVINPGSEYGEGLLHAALVVLEGGKVKAYQFIIG
jgi:Icc-related predicted phosphoesterase